MNCSAQFDGDRRPLLHTVQYEAGEPVIAVGAVFMCSRESAHGGPCNLIKVNPPCETCGGSVERPRWSYVHPTCYSCLPPPEPLPRVFVPSSEAKIEEYIRALRKFRGAPEAEQRGHFSRAMSCFFVLTGPEATEAVRWVKEEGLLP